MAEESKTKRYIKAGQALMLQEGHVPGGPKLDDTGAVVCRDGVEVWSFVELTDEQALRLEDYLEEEGFSPPKAKAQKKAPEEPALKTTEASVSQKR